MSKTIKIGCGCLVLICATIFAFFYLAFFNVTVAGYLDKFWLEKSSKQICGIPITAKPHIHKFENYRNLYLFINSYKIDSRFADEIIRKEAGFPFSNEYKKTVLALIRWTIKCDSPNDYDWIKIINIKNLDHVIFIPDMEDLTEKDVDKKWTDSIYYCGFILFKDYDELMFVDVWIPIYDQAMPLVIQKYAFPDCETRSIPKQ